MTVAAGDETFVHLVVEWLRECRFHVRVAGVAKLRLGDFEEAGLTLEVMHAVAVHAAYVGVAMRRALKVRVRSRVAV
jgi:hypothetical protein